MDNFQQPFCINYQRPVYFSYARNSKRKPEWNHISDCVDAILDLFKQRNIEYRLDVRDIGAGDNISDFEREIGWNSEVVVLVFSDKYFRSLHCMYEFVQIKNALKKYPQKRLLCVKSGDVDLSDPKYLLELEHYWGNIKQEYETIEFHHLRNHSGTEQAAFQNRFYINEIRNLYTFFKDLPCYDAGCDDLNNLANEVTNYYAHTSTSFLKVRDQRSQMFTLLKSFGCGVFLLLCLILGLIFYSALSSIADLDVALPIYSENVMLQDADVYTNITRVWSNDINTYVSCHSVNLTDDTLRKFQIEGAYLSTATRMLTCLEVSGCDNKKLPEYYPGGKGAFVDYKLEFPVIDADDNIVSLFFYDGYGIFDIQLPSNDKILPKVERPLYRESPNSLFVTDVEINEIATVVRLHFVNRFDCDTIVSISDSCCIQIKDSIFYIGGTNGITFYPFPTRVPRFSSLDFALYFPIISKDNDSIDLRFNDSTAVLGIQLHRPRIRTVSHPLVSGHSLGGGLVTEVEIDSSHTLLHFKYSNKFKNHPIFTAANSKSYIVANGEKYMIQGVSGVSMYPERTMIPANTSIEYALVFPPIPPETESIDFVNVEFSREMLGEKYRTMVSILGAECANEENTAFLTGIFGIQIGE